MTTTRFAPSPTGELHLGHVYAAKIAHDTARDDHGRFLLRQEDIDTARVRPEYYEYIEEDLRWLGLFWDGTIIRQSERRDAYEAALAELKARDLVYPCFCTRKDIQVALSAPHKRPASIYPGICREIEPIEAAERIAAGEAHSWRLDAQKAAKVHGELSFKDLWHGTEKVDPEVNGDVVLARKDIGVAYHLAVVVDDEFQEVTHVTRAEDLYSATHVHRQIQALLGYREPVYLHHECLCDEHGKRLAKRDHARSIRSLRAQGLSAGEVLARAEP